MPLKGTADSDVRMLLVPPVLNPVSASHLSNFIPIGLQALMSSLLQSGIGADIYMPRIPIVKDEDYRKVALDILSGKPSLIGFSTWCDSYPYSLLIAKEIKKAAPDVPIIFGGPQASIIPELTMSRFPFVDFILPGEADNTLPELIKELLNGSIEGYRNISGLYYRDENHETVSNSHAAIIGDLDSLPVPVYEMAKDEGIVWIDAGRGCPYRCTFCSTNQFFSKKYRLKSVDRLLEEIEYCSEKLGVRWIGISHDMFTLKEAFIRDFAEKLARINKKRKKSYLWSCSARTDCVSESLLEVMYKSGCRAIFYGLESASPKIQKEIRKNLDPDLASGIVRYSASRGFHTVVSYIIAFPNETSDDLNMSLRSIILEAAHGVNTQVTLLSVVPGTPLYSEYLNDLVYDGTYSGFSDIHMTGRSEDLVLNNPEIFSSFYHIPNKHIPRETLVLISKLGNYIELFIPTLSLIRDQLLEDLPAIDLCGYVEAHIPEIIGSDNLLIPELYFLIDSLRRYLESLLEKDLQPFARDVFKYDMTKAFMVRKFNRWQMINAMNMSQRQSERIRLHPKNRIRRRPYWDILESEHYLYEYILSPAMMRNRNSFRKGSYHYLVLPVSHRHANIYKIPKKELSVYRFEGEMSVGEIINKNKEKLPEDRILRIIRRMIQLGLIETTYPEETV